jgi:hypothetical protein
VRRPWALLYAIALCNALSGCFYVHTEGDDPPYHHHYYGGYGSDYNPYGNDDRGRDEWTSH